MKKWIYLLLVLMFLISCQRSVLEKVSDCIKQKKVNTIQLSDFTDFEWDTVWIINSQMKGDYLFLFKEKNIPTSPIENNLNRSFGIEQEFAPCIFIFTLKNKIVYHEFPPITNSWNIDAQSAFYISTPYDSSNYIILRKNKALFKYDKGALVLTDSII